MKKTYNINLNGRAFCIDEDAYIQLEDYIKALEKHYLAEEDGKEIMADIESRIAELLHEYLNVRYKEVISQAEIAQVIETMGTPEVIIDEDNHESTTTSATIKRKLYRDPEYAMLGGVASGLANYFDISRAVVRLLFILLTFGYGVTVVAYIILWIVIPKASSAKQKMEMRGERINVSNIEKNIRKTYNDVKKNSKLKSSLLQIEEAFSSICNSIIRIIGKIGSFILGLLSGCGLIFGIFALLTTCWVIFTAQLYTPERYVLFAQHAIHPVSMGIAKALLLLLFGIPFGMLAYLSSSYLFNWTKGRVSIFIGSSIIWMLTLFITLTLFGYRLGKLAHRSYSEEIVHTEICDTIQPLNIKFNHLDTLQQYSRSTIFHDHLDNYILDTDSWYKHAKGELMFVPNIHFRQTSKTTPEIIVKRTARGFTDIEAANSATKIEYHYAWNNDTLNLESYFSIHSPQWHCEGVDITILIPEGFQVNLTNLPRQGINYSAFRNRHKCRTNKCPTQRYVMKENKLVDR